MRRLVAIGVVCLCTPFFASASVWRAWAAPATTPASRVSVSSTGGDADGASSQPAISSNGRYVAFVSKATNLVAGGTNGIAQVFVRDRVAGTTSLVSVATNGTQGNKASSEPVISADGRYVAYTSKATNLVAGDTNKSTDVFERDLDAHRTSRVSVTSDGTQADAASYEPVISDDGNLVGFDSSATNLGAPSRVPYAGYIHNLHKGSTQLATGRVSPDPNECDARSILSRTLFALSGDGSHIAIGVYCSEFLSVYDRVRATGATQLVTVIVTGTGVGGSLSAPRYSDDGSTFAWIYANARVTTDIEFFDTTTGVSQTLDPPHTGVYRDTLGLSADGQRIAYVGGNGKGENFAFGPQTVGQEKVYSYDRDTGALRYLSVPLAGRAAEADGACHSPALSADGATAAFACAADDLATGDANGKPDVFVRTIASAPSPNLQAKLAVADVSVTEPATGSTNAVLTLSLDRPPQFDTEIDVRFVDGTAASPDDYDGSPQQITIAAGQTSATVNVPVYADGAAEPDETFVMKTKVAYGDVTRGPHADATVTIHDSGG